jgi:hypothetical protein
MPHVVVLPTGTGRLYHGLFTTLLKLHPHYSTPRPARHPALETFCFQQPLLVRPFVSPWYSALGIGYTVCYPFVNCAPCMTLRPTGLTFFLPFQKLRSPLLPAKSYSPLDGLSILLLGGGEATHGC